MSKARSIFGSILVIIGFPLFMWSFTQVDIDVQEKIVNNPEALQVSFFLAMLGVVLSVLVIGLGFYFVLTAFYEEDKQQYSKYQF